MPWIWNDKWHEYTSLVVELEIQILGLLINMVGYFAAGSRIWQLQYDINICCFKGCYVVFKWISMTLIPGKVHLNPLIYIYNVKRCNFVSMHVIPGTEKLHTDLLIF